MNLTTNPITGFGSTENDGKPLNALEEFYRAFNTRDLELMSANWANSDEASMSNPLGGVRRGWEAIEEAYSRIFAGPAEVYVEFYDYTIHHAESCSALSVEKEDISALMGSKLTLPSVPVGFTEWIAENGTRYTTMDLSTILHYWPSTSRPF